MAFLEAGFLAAELGLGLLAGGFLAFAAALALAGGFLPFFDGVGGAGACRAGAGGGGVVTLKLVVTSGAAL